MTSGSAQSIVKNIEWGVNYNIYLELDNDSSYSYDINDLFHSKTYDMGMVAEEFTYYPVSLSEDFLKQLKSRHTNRNKEELLTINKSQNLTLWSEIHNTLGGGWVHFINCILYALENNYLNIRAPIMKRPETNWKPKPMTQSYKRTKKWDYYVPIHQKHAIKEYKIRRKNNNLKDLRAVPPAFIELFLNTSEKDYSKMQKNNDFKNIAKIDLIKILLGASYLGKAQISYIKSSVFNAALQFSTRQLPSVIIFDDLEAAVAMNLNSNGYNIETIVFKNEDNLSSSDKESRIMKIQKTIDKINQMNKVTFEQALKGIYETKKN